MNNAVDFSVNATSKVSKDKNVTKHDDVEKN